MILGNIMFDKNSNNWTNDFGYNISFLSQIERFVNELINSRGYIYLNRIYELLGVKWDPNNENQCVIKGDRHQVIYVEFEIFKKPNNSILIMIHTF